MSAFNGGPNPPQQPGPFQPQPQPQGPQPRLPDPGQPEYSGKPPKKKHTVRNVLFGAGAVLVVILGAAGVGGAGDDTPAGSTVMPTPAVTSVDNGPTPDPITTPTNKPPVAKTTQPPAPKPTKTAPKLTAGQEQAIGAAEDYLSFSAFSRKGLIKQLSSEYGSGFSKADATFAVDHIKVDWNEQAVKAAKDYLSYTHFSRAGLIQQLESEYGSQFTHKQAVYGVTKAGL